MSNSRKPKDAKYGASLHGSDLQKLKIITNSRAFPQREKELSPAETQQQLQSSSASSSSEKMIDPRQGKLKKWEWIFNQEFYDRIDAFLDQEGLYPVDPKDALLGIRQFSKSGESKLSGAKSQTHSPTRLISCSPIESKLFQRRMSLSLAPCKLIQRLCKPLDTKMSNPLFQKMKAIEEVDSPALSRNNSECAASTPKRVADSKQVSKLLKDLSNECKSRGSSANPLVHSTSLESPELGSKRRRTDELVPLNGSLRLKTASSLILPSENSGRVSRRSKFFKNLNQQQNCGDDDSIVFSEKKLQNQEDDCPPMA